MQSPTNHDKINGTTSMRQTHLLALTLHFHILLYALLGGTMHLQLKRVIQIALLTLCIFTLLLSIWTLKKFTNYDFGSLVATLYLPVGKEHSFLPSLNKYVLLPSSFILLFFVYLTHTHKTQKVAKLMAVGSLLSILCLMVITLFWFFHLDVFDYLKSKHNNSSIYENFYAVPSEDICSFKVNKRNLIHIYLESFEFAGNNYETPYFNDRNVPRLAKLARENYSLTPYSNSHMDNVYGAGFTTGALVASTSGVACSISPSSILRSRKTFFKKQQH